MNRTEGFHPASAFVHHMVRRLVLAKTVLALSSTAMWLWVLTPTTNAVAQCPNCVAGSINGTARVTESGAFSYSIPIAVPPGTSGMQPGISLSYNSQAGNGLAGMGWSIGGLSAIHRCPKTKAQDQIKADINYDGTDKYCLDGQRLVAIAGTYGTSLAEYRTERDSFARIVSFGSANGGPDYWMVWTKAGQIIEYGNTADSKIEVSGGVIVRVWAANKVSDTSKNYMVFSYTKDAANGDFRPLKIEYTGNVGNPSTTPPTAAVLPYASVQFEYAARTDVAPMYHKGYVTKIAQRLSAIKTYAKVGGVDTMIMKYGLTYDNLGINGASRLKQIDECDAGNNCLMPTTFSQESTAGDNAYLPTLQVTANALAWYFPVVADFNGDGKADILFDYRDGAGRPSGARKLWLSTGDGTFQVVDNVNGLDGSRVWFWPEVGDFNGDGKADLLMDYRDGNGLPGGTREIWISNGDGTFDINHTGLYDIAQANGASTAWYWPVIGDFNGDGRADVLLDYRDGARRPGGYRRLYLSTASGAFQYFPNPADMNGYYAWWYPTVGDFNGDGFADMLMDARDGYGLPLGYRTIWQSNGDGTFSFVSNVGQLDGQTAWWWVETGDFNGDGKTDILLDLRDGTPLPWGIHKLLTSKGNGTFDVRTNVAGKDNIYQWYWPVIADYNGDGKSDIMLECRDGNTNPCDVRVFWLSRGDGTFDTSITNVANANSTGYPGYWAVPGDFNGDGKADILMDYRDGNKLPGGWRWLWRLAPGSRDITSSVSVGSGAVTSLTYVPMSTTGTTAAYTKDSGANAAQYPIVDIQSSMKVVKTIATSDGIGASTTNAVTYQYRGAKASIASGSWLGFRQVEAMDSLGMTTTITYRQDYPYQGMLTGLQRKSGFGITISDLQNSWSNPLLALSPPSGLPTPVAGSGGAYHVLQLDSATELSRELSDGQLISATTTTNAYDGYGNATTVTVQTSADGTPTNAHVKTTTNTYDNVVVNATGATSVGKWFLGRLRTSTVVSTKP